LGKAAIRLGRNFFLTEKEPKFVNRIKEEINKESSLFNRENIKTTFVDLENFILKKKGNR